VSVAGWADKNREWPAAVIGWRSQDAADARFADPRTVEYLFPDMEVVRVLAESGISLKEAWKRGLTSVNDISKPDLLRGAFGAKGIPVGSRSGLVIPHFALDGIRTFQYRPNVPYIPSKFKPGETPKERKYDWGSGGGSGISIGYNAARRLTEGSVRRLVIVEGTKQAIAADIYSPVDVGVVCVPGIWNGQSENELLEDLEALAREFHDITLIPDGDMAVKQHVWDGASLLCELLFDATCADLEQAMTGNTLDVKSEAYNAILIEGASRAPKVVTLATPDGIDDIIGQLDEDARADYVSGLLDEAGAMPDRPVKDGEPAAPKKPETAWDRLNAAVDASVFVETVYGGAVGGDRIELSEGELVVGRFERGAGPEFVKTTSLGAAKRLGIQVGKVATSTSLLIGAVTGKLAWAVLNKFDGMPTAFIEWLDDNADDLKQAASDLTRKAPKPKPDALRSILVAANGDIDKALALIKEAHTQETNR
jgi:hypothetical protein